MAKQNRKVSTKEQVQQLTEQLNQLQTAITTAFENHDQNYVDDIVAANRSYSALVQRVTAVEQKTEAYRRQVQSVSARIESMKTTISVLRNASMLSADQLELYLNQLRDQVRELESAAFIERETGKDSEFFFSFDPVLRTFGPEREKARISVREVVESIVAQQGGSIYGVRSTEPTEGTPARVEVDVPTPQPWTVLIEPERRGWRRFVPWL